MYKTKEANTPGVKKMSSALVFDTLQYANKLKAAGVSEKQAEIQAETLAEIVDNNLITKQDIKELELKTEQTRTDLQRDIKGLDLKIEQVKTDLQKDIKGLDLKIEQVKTDLQRDIKGLDLKIEQVKASLQSKIEQFKTDLQRDIKELELRMTVKLGGILVSSLGLLLLLMKLFKL